MGKLKKGQSLKLLPIAALLMITPLLSTSLRFKYLYFIVNILIIAVGAEAGLISFFLQSQQYHTKKLPSSVEKCSISDQVEANKTPSKPPSSSAAIPQPVVDKCLINSDRVEASKAPSKSSTQELMEDEELYHKSEIFIGNFYKQLKMQRQDSWNKLHHISHK